MQESLVEYCPLQTRHDDYSHSKSSCFISVSEVSITEIDIILHKFSATGTLSIFYTDKGLLEREEVKKQNILPRADGSYMLGYMLDDSGYNLPVCRKMPFNECLEYDETGTGFAYDQLTGGTMCKFFFKATFAQNMVHHRLPFDRIIATLQLRVRSHWFCEQTPLWWMMDGQSAVEVYKHQRERFAVKLSSVVQTEFKLCEAVVIGLHTNVVKLSARLERKPGFYLTNVMLPCFIFGCIACSAFLPAMPEFSDRISTISTMLLTLVAFKLMVNDWLPRLSYSTLLDWYFHSAMFFLVVQIVVAVFASMREASEKQSVDKRILTCLLCLWCVGHTLILVAIRCKFLRPGWEDPDDDSTTYLTAKLDFSGSMKAQASESLVSKREVSRSLT